MVYNPEKSKQNRTGDMTITSAAKQASDWVSEPGTITTTSVRAEPFSINERGAQSPQSKDNQQFRITSMAGNDSASVSDSEPSTSADQRDASASALMGRLESATSGSAEWIIYATVAAIGLLAVREAM